MMICRTFSLDLEKYIKEDRQVAEEAKHKRKYLENKSILENEMNVEKSEHYNWIATIAFYAALHLVEGELSKDKLHSKTHSDRGNVVERYAAFRNIRTQYKNLHDRSIIARYEGSNISKKKAEQALEWLKDIEDEIQL